MLGQGRRIASALFAGFLVCAYHLPATAADPEIDQLLQSPVGKDWVTNGGNMTNQRYSTLKQIDTSNVKQLKGAWMTRLKGSGFGGKYSFEATPLVKDGIMYIVTGNDDVFALNAKTGEFLWERWSGIDQKLTSVCCGWDNRGVAMGEGMVFLGQLDANVVALDAKTGKEVWKTPIEVWQDGYGITSAPLYYDGIVYSGITGGEYGVRGRLTALDAKTGKILWRFYTLPAPGDVGGDTWPAGTDHYMHGGASIWNTPALDPRAWADLLLGRQLRAGLRRVDARGRQSVLRVRRRGECQDRPIRLALPGGAPRHLGLRRGEPGGAVRHRHQRPAAQGHCPGRTHRLGLYTRPHQRQAAGRHRGEAGAAGAAAEDREDPALSDRRRDRAAMRPAAGGIRKGRLHLRGLLGRAGPGPAVGHRRHELVAHVVQSGHRVVLRSRHRPHQRLCALRGSSTRKGKQYNGGTQAAPIGSAMSGTWTAIGGNTNKIAWQKNVPFRVGSGGGSTTTAGGLVFHGDPGGEIQARDAKTGELLWQFQTGFGAEATPMVYEVDGEQYIAIAAGGNQGVGSANGDAVWTFSLKGQLNPLWPPPPPATIAGPASGPIADNADTVKIGDQQHRVRLLSEARPHQGGDVCDLHQCGRHAAHGDIV